MPRTLTLLLLALCCTGCVERRLEITSEPSGALVWVNDQQVGRTPAQASFLYHGVYDIRLELDGYEPLRAEAEAKPPIYEHAPLDLFAEALPMRLENTQRWHFILEPSLESTLAKEQLEADLLARAGAMREALDATAPVEENAPPSDE
ncbi:hypothetical protein MNBD_PLANCTO03-162 [hydrothermal vent metagenome]|uniref:PEGA domain-containing protein n=1 Tax=hydrothermal vent metagenome TaxID=652676 RepID=A0A3B1DZA5_9ZZZZ